jgi:hypothetical protein
MPKNGVLLDVDEYGREKMPPKAQRTWTKPKKGDKVGFTIHLRGGTVHEVVFRMPEPEAKKGKTRSTDGDSDSDEAATPKKTRPEITHKGDEIIGALRTEALVKSLEVNAVDDATLIGGGCVCHTVPSRDDTYKVTRRQYASSIGSLNRVLCEPKASLLKAFFPRRTLS